MTSNFDSYFVQCSETVHTNTHTHTHTHTHARTRAHTQSWTWCENWWKRMLWGVKLVWRVTVHHAVPRKYCAAYVQKYYWVVDAYRAHVLCVGRSKFLAHPFGLWPQLKGTKFWQKGRFSYKETTLFKIGRVLESFFLRIFIVLVLEHIWCACCIRNIFVDHLALLFAKSPY